MPQNPRDGLTAERMLGLSTIGSLITAISYTGSPLAWGMVGLNAFMHGAVFIINRYCNNIPTNIIIKNKLQAHIEAGAGISAAMAMFHSSQENNNTSQRRLAGEASAASVGMAVFTATGAIIDGLRVCYSRHNANNNNEQQQELPPMQILIQNPPPAPANPAVPAYAGIPMRFGEGFAAAQVEEEENMRAEGEEIVRGRT